MTTALHPAPATRRLLVPKAPVLVLDGHRLFCLSADGEPGHVTDEAARAIIAKEMPIVCHGPQIAARLKIQRFHAYDALELFAFIYPGKFTAPTPRGIARSLHLLEPDSAEDQCMSLRDAVRHMLADLSAPGRAEKSDPAALAAMMGLSAQANDTGENGWPWARVVLAALGRADDPPARAEIRAALKIWEKLPEWAVHAPEPPPGHHGVSEEESVARLRKLLSLTRREDRPQQRAYAAALGRAFAPVNNEDETRVVIAEAGTGTGKTLGYLAPATVWAEKNGGPVWVSTYTRNLQRQVDAELDRLYEDPAVKARKVVTRKGRENYLCLLNLEDNADSPAIHTNDISATALGLMIRWAAITADGDMGGRDFPGWLAGLMGPQRIRAFADRHGECIYSACPHFNKCFVEKSIRKSKRADIVIANHALVMSQAAAGDVSDSLPQRVIFDEGHHIFEAADSAFSAHLNGMETEALRRWILGTETQRRTRARGIRRRLEDLVADDDTGKREMDALMEAARALPGPGWRERLHGGEPKGAAENFLALCRQQVHARNKEEASSYSLETPVMPPIPGLFEAAGALAARLKDLQRPMLALSALLLGKLDDEAETLDTDQRQRLHFLSNSLKRRAQGVAGAWIDMLATIAAPAQQSPFADWLEITRIEGMERDVGFYRCHIDPAAVFAEQLKPFASGVAVTSATLRDISESDPDGWQSAAARAGVRHFDAGGLATSYFSAPSPFDYAEQTRVIVVTDVKKDNPDEAAAAFRALFLASGGGALGIFTAVQRLKAAHTRLLPKLAEQGIALYAQHADPLDISTLIDIFREEEDACLLGTDATRDGIDVPGRALRLVVYDRVPWPRPTILHKARRAHFGRGYDDMLTRFKLKQAYGRLIRTATDRGVFVMLDGALPTRLLGAFPEGVEVLRLGLREAVEIVRAEVGTRKTGHL